MTPTITAAAPAIPRDGERGYVALHPSGPRDETAIHELLLPWRRRDTGEYQVHVSSIPTLVAMGLVRKPAGLATVTGYATEARLTFDKPALTTYPSDAEAERFLKLFTPAYKVRPYQLAGMSRMLARCLDQTIRGCILADDVGLGKTAQIIGVILALIDAGLISKDRPFGVVTTASTVAQWAEEFARFSARCPTLAVVNDGASGKAAALAKRAEVYILNYETLRLPRYRAGVSAIADRIGGVAFDESSAAGNPASSTHNACMAFGEFSDYRIAANATPIENDLRGYYGQLRLINERVVGEPVLFARRYLEMENDRIKGAVNVREFRIRTCALYFRRTAEMVGEQMPQVVASMRRVRMGPAQVEAYESAIRQCFAKGNASVHSIQNVSALQRAACATNINDPRSPSAKMDDVEHLLATELQGQKVIIFTRLATIARYAAARLSTYAPYLITGDVPQRQRTEIRKRFEQGGRVLVGTDAVSKGLNLQTASVVINLDLPWNPARLKQRVGRVRRIGQAAAKVRSINYDALHPQRKRTVDRFFIALVLKKQVLTDQVFGKDGVDVLGATDQHRIAQKALAYLAKK